jgi:hypothetical protein
MAEINNSDEESESLLFGSRQRVSRSAGDEISNSKSTKPIRSAAPNFSSPSSTVRVRVSKNFCFLSFSSRPNLPLNQGMSIWRVVS